MKMKKSKFEEFLARQLEERLSAAKVETEQKYRTSDPVNIRRHLIRLGAKKIRTGLEHNELYELGKMLRKKKQVLRLRYHGDYGAWLTLKGHRLQAQHKKRMEMETPVHYEHTKRILELLGFRVFSVYRKNREEYELEDCHVCLDYLASCGWFVEIEGAHKAIKRMAQELGLNEFHREERSYRKILKEQVSSASLLA
jgi:predicted adenylyl cyclase CyaB